MPWASEFIDRTLYLEDQVGHNKITAGCTVNQPYAQNQHETVTFRHAVGRARYLGDPLMENAFGLINGLARAAITEAGSDISEEMRGIANNLADYVRVNAPRDPDFGDVLANSGSPFVEDDGVEVYRRPPIAPRTG